MLKEKLTINPLIEKHSSLNEVSFGDYIHVRGFCIFDDVVIGDYSYFAGYNQIYNTTIGKFCSVASYARINTTNHPSYKRIAQHHFTYRSEHFGFGDDDLEFFAERKSKRVSIGNDVWIGHNAIIMQGVKIGNGAVIGAGALVNHDVEPYSVVVGVPARHIKYRFSDELITKIEKLKWWDWSHHLLKERISDFRNIDIFIRKYL